MQLRSVNVYLISIHNRVKQLLNLYNFKDSFKEDNKTLLTNFFNIFFLFPICIAEGTYKKILDIDPPLNSQQQQK